MSRAYFGFPFSFKQNRCPLYSYEERFPPQCVIEACLRFKPDRAAGKVLDLVVHFMLNDWCRRAEGYIIEDGNAGLISRVEKSRRTAGVYSSQVKLISCLNCACNRVGSRKILNDTLFRSYLAATVSSPDHIIYPSACSLDAGKLY